MIFHAFVLGLVQALGELLPISSSAHLIIVPWLFRWKDAELDTLTFDVALHLGTLFAVICYFYKDWTELLKEAPKGFSTAQSKLFWYIIIATIPGAIVGKLLEEKAEHAFRNPILIGCTLIGMGIVLAAADWFGKKNEGEKELSFGQCFMIGCSQALAIIPGVSRSGATISTGLFLGLKRDEAARFSFMLSTPIIAGAAILKLKGLHIHDIDTAFIVGVLTSAIGGFFVINFLMKYIRKASYMPFVYYRVIVGAIIIAIALMRH